MTHTLLIHQAFVAPGEPGGTRHYEFAQYCLAQGDQVTVVASNLSYLTGKPVLEGNGLVQTQKLNDITVLRSYTYPSLHHSFMWRVVSFLSFMATSVWAGSKAKNIDLVMGTSPPIFQAVSAWLVSLIHRRPLLLEVRDLWPEFAIDMGVLKNPILIGLSRMLENFLYARAHHILVNSPAYRDYLTQKGIASAKISLIPNGVDTTMFSPDTDGTAVRKTWGLEKKFVVTYAGALGMANDIDNILRAAEQLRNQKDIHFLLVGDGKERNNLQEKAKQLNLTNVTFTGSQPKSEMAAMLAASDVCLATLLDIPMFKTTYPNKVFDYMAASRPTILAIDGVIREVVEQAQGGIFVPPSDHKALAQAVQELAEDRSKAQQMGKNARCYVVEHFDRQLHSAQFVELINKSGTSNDV